MARGVLLQCVAVLANILRLADDASLLSSTGLLLVRRLSSGRQQQRGSGRGGGSDGCWGWSTQHTMRSAAFGRLHIMRALVRFACSGRLKALDI
jgi:hypothetical protein